MAFADDSFLFHLFILNFDEVHLPRLSPIEIANLLDRYGDALSLYARQFTSAHDDCVQEAFVKLAAIESPDNPVAWLYRVVRNQSLNTERSHRRRVWHESSKARSVPSFELPEAALEQQDEQRRLLEMLDQLSDDHRELIVLRIWSCLTWEQIGSLTESPPSSAHRKYSVALERLKLLMSDASLKRTNQLVNQNEK